MGGPAPAGATPSPTHQSDSWPGPAPGTCSMELREPRHRPHRLWWNPASPWRPLCAPSLLAARTPPLCGRPFPSPGPPAEQLLALRSCKRWTDTQSHLPLKLARRCDFPESPPPLGLLFREGKVSTRKTQRPYKPDFPLGPEWLPAGCGSPATPREEATGPSWRAASR